MKSKATNAFSQALTQGGKTNIFPFSDFLFSDFFV